MSKMALFLTGIFVVLFFVLFSPHSNETGEARDVLSGEIVIAGTGDSQELLRGMAGKFEEANPETVVNVPDSIGSGGGIRTVADGKADLGRTARPLKEKEKKYGLTYERFAVSPIVFAVHPSVENVDNLTPEQIVDIYSGRITNWKELGGGSSRIYPIGREDGDSSRAILERNMPGFESIETPVYIIFYTTPETMEALENHKYTIGYGPLAMVRKTGLKILKIDDVYPSEENIEKGRYKLTVPFALVHNGDPTPLAGAFLDFVFSPGGRRLISDYGCIPIGRNE